MPRHEPCRPSICSQMASMGGSRVPMFPSLFLGHGEGTGQVVRRSTWSSVTFGGWVKSWGAGRNQGLHEGEKRQRLNVSLDPSLPGTCMVMSTVGCGREGPTLPPRPHFSHSTSWWFVFTYGVTPRLFLPSFSLHPLGNISPLPAGSLQPPRDWPAWFFQLDQRHQQRCVSPWGSRGEISEYAPH